nr:MAG TPA: hypothetical protein [Caudoviricetes sp.]
MLSCLPLSAPFSTPGFPLFHLFPPRQPHRLLPLCSACSLPLCSAGGQQLLLKNMQQNFHKTVRHKRPLAYDSQIMDNI